MASHLPILAAEDEETDFLLLSMALKQAHVPNRLVLAKDGQDAVEYLAGLPPYDDRASHPLPGLLLLDLKMPRMSGFDVLEWIAARPAFRELPVIVLSSSSNEADIALARRLGAREYLVKPHDFRKLTQVVTELAARWLVPVPQEA